MKDVPDNRQNQSNETLQALYRISRVGNSSSSAKEAYEVIMQEIRACFDPFAASISVISPDTGLLEKEYAHGYSNNIEELALHVGKGITGRAAFIGEPILSPDVEKDPSFVKLIEGVRCKVAVPMIADDQILGVIDIDSDQPEAYTHDDVERLVLIADEATRSLQSVWKQRELEKQSRQLKALFEVGQKIVSKLELQGLWDSITEAAMELSGARICSLQLFEKSANEVVLQAARPESLEYNERVRRLKIEESIASSAVRTKRQVEFQNITTPEYLDIVDIPREADVATCLSTPIIFEGVVIGIINVYTRKRHRFDNNEKRLLQAFASLSAIAAKNAELYARVFNSEENLRKSERLTMLGLLSAEIAHEIRNPLTVIKLLFGSLGLNYDALDPRDKDVSVIKEKINHLEEIVSKVLSFGKAPESLHSNWNIDELIEDTCILVRHKMSQQKINLQRIPAPTSITVSGNKGQLQQVMLNLIINASEAMPNGGSLTIETQLKSHDNRQSVAILFSDTGSGIPQEFQNRIFDSFLTGKPEGTGLGLSIVKRILRSHRGDISIAQTSSSGTTMQVELPVA